MMIERFEQILAVGLEHPDMMVRSEALVLLADCQHKNPETTMTALRQLDRHGWNGAYEFSYKITKLPHSEESMAWLANRLEVLAPARDKEVANEVMHLVNWFCKAPVPLIMPHMNRFLHTVITAPPPATGSLQSHPVKFASKWVSFELAARRLEAAILPVDQCFDKLDATLQRCAASPDFPDAEVMELELWCETIAHRGAVSLALLSEWLDAFHDMPPDEDPNIVEYRAGAAVLILKHGRLALPVKKLLCLLEADWDWLNEEIQEALSSAGDSTTLGILLESYPHLSWSSRLYITGVFEVLRFPEHESALIEVLNSEEDEDLCAYIARTLVLYGSETSMARAREASKVLDPGGEQEALMDALCLCDMLGDSPKEESLRYIDGMRRRMEVSREQFSSLEHSIMPGLTGDGEKAVRPIGISPPVNLHQIEAQTGRNSPCPCGSGKKFKKCCGG